MRKFLLLSAAAAVAATASAGLTDVTPKGYDFESGREVPFLDAYENSDWGCLPWNPAVYFVTRHPETYKDGLVLMVGPNIHANWDSFKKGAQIVDLGGEVGKVLCIGGVGSGAEAALKARGIDVALPTFETSPGYLIPLWHADPEISNAEAGGVENALRVQVVLNIYEDHYLIPDSNNPESMVLVGTHFQPYMQFGGNWQPNEDNNADRAVYSYEFCYNWGEAEASNHRIDYTTADGEDLEIFSAFDDESIFDQGLECDRSGYVWNPNRWMVYEWDVPFGEKGEDDPTASDCPIKIKMEMPELTNGATVFIKSVKFLMKDADEEPIAPTTRRKTWKYMDVATASVANVAAEADALNVTVNGNAVTLSADAVIYSVSGVAVADVAAGQTVELSNGFYVAAANGKSAKFAVK